MTTNANLTGPPANVLTASSIISISNQIMNLSVGLLLNAYVLLLLFRGGGADNAFTVSQCVSELLFSLTGPLSITCHVRPRLCLNKVLGYLWGVSMISRGTFQCCMCLERYLAVVHPVAYLKYNHGKYRPACAAMIWISSLALSVWIMATFPRLPFTYLALLYGTVLTLDLFCCLSILRALRRPRPGRTHTRKEKDQEVTGAKRKAFKMVCMNVMILMLQAVPLSSVFSARQYFTSLEAFNLAISVCMMLNILGGFVQPMLFVLKADKLGMTGCLK